MLGDMEDYLIVDDDKFVFVEKWAFEFECWLHVSPHYIVYSCTLQFLTFIKDKIST